MGKLKQSEMQRTINFLHNDFLQLISDIGKIEDSDDYWQEVSDKSNEVFNRTGQKLFNKILILALVEYLSIVAKLQKDKNVQYVEIRWKIKVR